MYTLSFYCGYFSNILKLISCSKFYYEKILLSAETVAVNFTILLCACVDISLLCVFFLQLIIFLPSLSTPVTLFSLPPRHPVAAVLCDVLRATNREKVQRVILATFRVGDRCSCVCAVTTATCTHILGIFYLRA